MRHPLDTDVRVSPEPRMAGGDLGSVGGFAHSSSIRALAKDGRVSLKPRMARRDPRSWGRLHGSLLICYVKTIAFVSHCVPSLGAWKRDPYFKYAQGALRCCSALWVSAGTSGANGRRLGLERPGTTSTGSSCI